MERTMAQTPRLGTDHDLVGLEPDPAQQGVRMHRTDVIRRLLVGGISANTLQRILPEWTELIDATVAALAKDGLLR